MLHTTVTRFALGLGALFLGVCLLYALSARWRHLGTAAGSHRSMVPGAELFSRSCEGCHSSDELAPALAAAPDRGPPVLDLLDFLEQHGVSTPEEDRAIVRFLLGRDPSGATR